MQTTETIQKKQATLENIYNEVKSMRKEMNDKLDLIRFLLVDFLIPEEEISNEEREELERIEKEPGRSLEDVMAEIDGAS